MATPQREAAAPPQAANAVEGGSFSNLIEAAERANLDRVLKDSIRSAIENFHRLHDASEMLLSEFAKKEAQVQMVMEELESERAEKEAQVQKVMRLESEKAQKEVQVHKLMAENVRLQAQKEAQVQKLMAENVRLHSMVDMKEAQVQAMSEQCKFMALNHHN